MRVGALLRELWRLRLLVMVAALVAVVAAVLTAYRPSSDGLEPRRYEVGEARATFLVDTPRSQAVDLGPDTGAGVADLTDRAALLAQVMTRSPVKDRTAESVGLSPSELDAATTSVTGAAAPKLAAGRDASVLRVAVPEVVGGVTPVLVVEAQAPTPEAARRLTGAAVRALRGHLADEAERTGVPPRRRVVVRSLEPSRAEIGRRGPPRALAPAVGLVVLVLGGAAILGGARLTRGLRAEQV